MEAKEDVRSRLNIEDVIGEYVQLKRAGRNYKGLSPFSEEKTPSFFVSPDKNIWHDFSSNKGGDIFSFIMEVESMDFRQALEYLAKKAGVDLSIYQSKSSQELSKNKDRLYGVLDLAASYYQHSLIKNKHAVEYVFDNRGFNKSTVSEFRIGYAPGSSDALVSFLTKKGYNSKELKDAGLINRYGGDLFRERITIPLTDYSGRVIGFTARTLVDIKNAPKYLNTPQTILYDKSRHVFALSNAKDSIRKSDYAVIVEGNLDVISSHQVGIKQVVATAGTAITDYHLRALQRITTNIRLAFDEDNAGIAATERAIAIAQNIDIDLMIIELSEGAKDPDDLIRKDMHLWEKSINNPQPAIDWVLEQYSKTLNLTTALGKRKFTTAGLKVISRLRDTVEQEHYQLKIADMVKSSLDSIKSKQENNQYGDNVQLKKIHTSQSANFNSDKYSYQDDLLAVALIDVKSQSLLVDFDINIFIGDNRRQLANYISKNSGKLIVDTPKQLKNIDQYVKIVLLKAEARYADWNDHDRYYESARLLRQVTYDHKKQQKDILTVELRQAETNDDEDRALAIRSKLNNLIKEMNSAKR